MKRYRIVTLHLVTATFFFSLLSEPFIERLKRESHLLTTQLEEVIKGAGIEQFYKSVASDTEGLLMQDLLTRVRLALPYLKKSISLKKRGECSSFILREVLAAMKKNPQFSSKTWNALPAQFKEVSLFKPAYCTVLEEDPEAVKRALKFQFYGDSHMQEFIESLCSFTDQSSLESFNEETACMDVLFNREEYHFSLKPHLEQALMAGCLKRAPLTVLESIAQRYRTVAAYEITSPPMIFWLPYDEKAHKLLITLPLIEEAILRIAIIYQIRDWFGVEEVAHLPAWYFLPTPVTKLFPKPGTHFTIEQYSSIESCDQGIVCFRQEELLKNSVAEMLRILDIEKILHEVTASKWLKKRCAVQRDDQELSCKESLIESVATIITTLINAVEMSTKKTSKKVLRKAWALEKSFALYQAAKLLYVSGFESVEEFLNPAKTVNRVRETVPSAEAFMFRAALLFKPEQLLLILKDKSHESLEKLILTNMEDSVFNACINQLLSWLKKHHKPTELFMTGRITLMG